MPQQSNENELNRFDASTDEEIDALELNLVQDGDDVLNSEDGSGLIDDDLARDQIEGITEVGPDLADKGVDNVAPGRDDTSSTIRRHRPAGMGSSESAVEANLDEPRDETIMDREEDEDTAA